MKPSDAAKIVAMLITAWPDSWRFLNPDQQEYSRKLYREFLIDLDYQVTDAAVRRLIGTCTKMPPVATIRAACSELTEGRLDRGGEAWGKTLKLIGRYGMNRRPRGDDEAADTPDTFEVPDPILKRVLFSMGWRELCQSENQTADRARVIELYEQLALQTTADRQVRAIAPTPVRRSIVEGKAQSMGELVAGLVPK